MIKIHALASTLLLVTIFTSTVDIVARHRSKGKYRMTISSKAQPSDLSYLVLTTSVIERECVDGDSDLYGLRLTLKLTFLNKGDRAILLPKDFSLGHIWISRNIEEALSKKYELSSSISSIANRSKKVEALTMNDFEVLSKGETYETKIKTTVFVRYDSTREIVGAVSNGSHVLQLGLVSSLPGDKSELIQQKFGKGQVVYTQRVVSEPMELVF